MVPQNVPIPSVELTDCEGKGVDLILQCLSDGGCDASTIVLVRTEQYLKLVADTRNSKFLVDDAGFCRLKLTGQVYRLSLRLDYESRKTFFDKFPFVERTRKAYVDIPIAEVEDICTYFPYVLSSHLSAIEEVDCEQRLSERAEKEKNIKVIRRRNIPSFDKKLHEKYAKHLISSMPKIAELATSGKSDTELAFAGLACENDGTAIVFYEAAILCKINAPYYYKRLATLYREWGLFEHELRITEAALSVFRENSKNHYWALRRKAVVESILELL